MSETAKRKPIDLLMAAMDRCAMTRGNAQWTQGYRARYEREMGHEHPEAARLRTRENHEWELNGEAEKAFRRLAMRLLREAATAKRPSSNKRANHV